MRIIIANLSLQLAASALGWTIAGAQQEERYLDMVAAILALIGVILAACLLH
jgi:hypothetical protein